MVNKSTYSMFPNTQGSTGLKAPLKNNVPDPLCLSYEHKKQNIFIFMDYFAIYVKKEACFD